MKGWEDGLSGDVFLTSLCSLGRRISAQSPGELIAQQNPDVPVVKQGHWTQKTDEELDKQDDVQLLRVSIDLSSSHWFHYFQRHHSMNFVYHNIQKILDRSPLQLWIVLVNIRRL